MDGFDAAFEENRRDDDRLKFVRAFSLAPVRRSRSRHAQGDLSAIQRSNERLILNTALSEIRNVDARRGADVFLEILLSKGGQYIFVRKLVGGNRYFSRVQMK